MNQNKVLSLVCQEMAEICAGLAKTCGDASAVKQYYKYSQEFEAFGRLFSVLPNVQKELFEACLGSYDCKQKHVFRANERGEMRCLLCNTQQEVL